MSEDVDGQTLQKEDHSVPRRGSMIVRTAGQILNPLEDFRDEHKRAVDYLLELIQGLERRDRKEVGDRLGWINRLAGPHWRYEEEALYPLCRRFCEELMDKLLVEHDQVIQGVRRLVQLIGKREIAAQAWGEGVDIARFILFHMTNCDGLSLFIEQFTEEERQTLKQAMFAARQADIPLLEWALRFRQRKI